MVKPGAAVVDVGITRTDAGNQYPNNPPRLVGDVAPDVAEVAGWLAPMPGGVGPMTRAMLLANVVEAAEAAAPRGHRLDPLIMLHYGRPRTCTVQPASRHRAASRQQRASMITRRATTPARAAGSMAR